MNCNTLEEWISSFFLLADDITQRYYEREWWQQQILLAVDLNRIDLIKTIYQPEQIFCSNTDGYECLTLNLEKRLLNPQLIANLSYAVLNTTNSEFRNRLVPILSDIYSKVCEQKYPLLLNPSINFEEARVDFWKIDQGNVPSWFETVYNLNWRQSYGITPELVNQYSQILFGQSLTGPFPNRQKIHSEIRGLDQFILNVRNARNPQIIQNNCQRILVTVSYKNLPYGSVLLYYNLDRPDRIRMEWIFRFPIYSVLQLMSSNSRLLSSLPRINSLLIPNILKMLQMNLPEFPSLHQVSTIYVDPVDLQSDYLQNYYLFVYDLEKSNYYPCETIDSGNLSSKLKFRFRD